MRAVPRSFAEATRALPHTAPLRQATPLRPRTAPAEVGVPWEVAVRAEDDIVRAVDRARSTAGRVRAAGSGGSKNANRDTPDGRLDLSAYDRVIAVDGNLVTVQAGMTVARLQEILARHGLALPTPGEWSGATVAGSLATGTHGGSAYHGCMATSLASVRLVNGLGGVTVLRRGDPGFDHVGISLGMLGVVSEVTFACSRQFHLALERRLVPFHGFLRQYRDQLFGHEFMSAIWFPAAGQALTFTADRCPAEAPGRPRPRRYSAVSACLFRVPTWGKAGAGLLRRTLRRAASGSSAEILSPIRISGRRVRWLRRVGPDIDEIEFAVPLERGTDALVALEALLRRWPRSLKLPVGIRPTAGDGFSLSPCSGRDVLWISTFHRGERGFVEALGELFERFDARCHWGKALPCSPARLRARFPRFAAFERARVQLDPTGVFLNPFTEELVR